MVSVSNGDNLHDMLKPVFLEVLFKLFELEFYGHHMSSWSVYLTTVFVWGFMAQSTQWGYVERGQFT